MGTMHDEIMALRSKAIDKVTALGAVKDLKGLMSAAQVEIDSWQRKEAPDPAVLAAISSALASADLGDWDQQHALVEHCSLTALSQHEQLSVLDEVAFVLRLAAQPSAKASKGQLTSTQRTGLWLRATARVRAALDPAFDPADAPLFRVAPPEATGLPPGVAADAIADPGQRAAYQQAIDKNQRKAANYLEQHQLRRAQATLHGGLQRYLRSASAQADFSAKELESLLATHLLDLPLRTQLLEFVRGEVAKSAPAAAPPLAGMTARVAPRDDFRGRSITLFGIGEEIDLSYDDLSPLAAEQHGGLAWSIEEGGGAILYGDRHGQATYRVGATAGQTRLVAKVLSGPNKGAVVGSVGLVSVMPTGGFMTMQPGTGVWHVQNSFSVGFRGVMLLTPGNVSYAGVIFREGSGMAVASGWLSPMNGLIHPIGQAHTITGAQVDGIDTVSTGQRSPPPAYAAGDFLWPIPWQYSGNNGATWTTFTMANHHSTISPLGMSMVEKAGAGPFMKNAADPTSSY